MIATLPPYLYNVDPPMRTLNNLFQAPAVEIPALFSAFCIFLTQNTSLAYYPTISAAQPASAGKPSTYWTFSGIISAITAYINLSYSGRGLL